MTEQEALFKYCLRLGDNALIHAYRLSEWCRNAPLLEEDLALTNFALDLIGRAQMLLTYAGQVEGLGRTEDDLAYRRSERAYYNNLMVELPNGDFAHTIAKLLFTATYEFYFFSELMQSKDEHLAAIAAKTIKEVKYHMTHASDWLLRLGDGTYESHTRMQAAIDQLWTYTGELFETDDVDAILEDKNIAVDMALVHPKWLHHIETTIKEATLTLPQDGYMQTGSHLGVHTEYMGHILAEMQYLQRAYPDALW